MTASARGYDDPLRAGGTVDDEMVVGCGAVETGPNVRHTASSDIGYAPTQVLHGLVSKLLRSRAVDVRVDDLPYPLYRDLDQPLTEQGETIPSGRVGIVRPYREPSVRKRIGVLDLDQHHLTQRHQEMPPDLRHQPSAPHPARHDDPVEFERASALHMNGGAICRLVDDRHRRFLPHDHAVLARNAGHHRNGALALDIPRPVVEYAHLVVVDDELRESGPALFGRHDRQVSPSTLQIAPVLVHSAARLEAAHDLHAARPVVHRLARPPFPRAPLLRRPFHQLHIRPAVSVPRPSDTLRHVGGRCVLIGHPPLIEDRHAMPALAQLDCGRKSKHPSADDSNVHNRSPEAQDEVASSVHHQRGGC